jgi:carbonic anhydrase
MSATNEALRNNETYARGFDKGQLPLPPAKKLAVVACMDARLHVSKILGLNEGDAHVIRNAGGAVTEDAIRSLTISQRLLGTEEVILIHHTDCGMLTFTDEAVKAQIQKDAGIRPHSLSRPFRTSKRTFGSPSLESRPAPSFRRRIEFEDSSTT